MKRHQNLEKIFENLFKLPVSKSGNSKCLIIFSTPRCGSTFFCNTLRQYGDIGFPEEWFDDLHLRAFCNVIGKDWVDFWDYFSFLRNRTSSSKGWFSVKVHISQWAWLKSKGVDIDTMPIHTACWLYRRDKLSQAYSFLKAEQTGQWQSKSRQKKNFNPDQVEPADVLRKVLEIAEMEALYKKEIKYLTSKEFAYEDFSDIKHSKAFHNLISILDINPSRNIDEISPKIERQQTADDMIAINRIRDWLYIK